MNSTRNFPRKKKKKIDTSTITNNNQAPMAETVV